MKKAGKIVIGLVCVGAFGVLMFTRFTKKEEPIEAVPNPTVVVQTCLRRASDRMILVLYYSTYLRG